MGDFYGTGIEIWAGFGRIGSTEKRVWTDYEKILWVVFSCFQEQKKCLIFFSFLPRKLKKQPQKLLRIGPMFFFSVMPTGPNPAQISIPVP